MPARTARGQEEPIYTAELPWGQIKTPKDRRRLFRVQASPHGVTQALGLLEDFLEHVVGE